MFENTLKSILKIIFSISLFVFVNPVYLIHEDQGRDSSPAIGSVSAKINDVYIQSIHSLAWKLAERGSPVYEGDRIFVGKESYATLILKNKIEVFGQENSVFIVSLENDVNKIEIEKGGAYLNLYPAQKLVIQNGDILIAKEGSQIHLENISTGLHHSLIHGSIDLQSVDDSKQVSFITRKTVPETEKKIKLFQPRQNPRNKNDHMLVQFTWSWPDSPMNWKVQLSKNANFEDKVYTYKTPQEEKQINLRMPEGTWYWRVIGQRLYDDQEYISSANVFDVTTAPRLHREIASIKKARPPRPQLKRLAPFGIEFIPLLQAGLTKVQWKFADRNARFQMKVDCSKLNQPNMDLYTYQSQIALDMSTFSACSLKVKSREKSKYISEWSQLVKIPKQGDYKP